MSSRTKKIVGAVVAGAVIAILGGVWLNDDDTPPYTVSELLRAEGDCDVKASTEYLEDALAAGIPRDQAIAESFSAGAEIREDCLTDRLPELSEDEIADFEGTIEKTREYEFEQK